MEIYTLTVIAVASLVGLVLLTAKVSRLRTETVRHRMALNAFMIMRANQKMETDAMITDYRAALEELKNSLDGLEESETGLKDTDSLH